MAENKLIPSNLIIDKELSLLKKAFAENDALLVVMRNLFFGFDLSESDKQSIKVVFKDKEVFESVRNRLVPTIRPDMPMEVAADMWTGLDFQGFGDREIDYIIRVRETVFEMFETALNLLRKPDGKKVDISFDSKKIIDPFQRSVTIGARNKYIAMITYTIGQIKLIAGQKDETLEQAKARIIKNSTK